MQGWGLVLGVWGLGAVAPWKTGQSGAGLRDVAAAAGGVIGGGLGHVYSM